MRRIVLLCAIVCSIAACSNSNSNSTTSSSESVAVDYQDVTKFTSDEFLYALYHKKVEDYPVDKDFELTRKYFTPNCIRVLRNNYEFDGEGYAVWDLFGGSNTSVWGSFKGMEYAGNGWYRLQFAFEDENDGNYYIEHIYGGLYLKVMIVNGKWVIDDCRYGD